MYIHVDGINFSVTGTRSCKYERPPNYYILQRQTVVYLANECKKYPPTRSFQFSSVNYGKRKRRGWRERSFISLQCEAEKRRLLVLLHGISSTVNITSTRQNFRLGFGTILPSNAFSTNKMRKLQSFPTFNKYRRRIANARLSSSPRVMSTDPTTIYAFRITYSSYLCADSLENEFERINPLLWLRSTLPRRLLQPLSKSTYIFSSSGPTLRVGGLPRILFLSFESHSVIGASCKQ